MKILVIDTGGRPLNNDDLVVLQSEATDAAAAQYLGRGAFIISGCAVTGSGPAYNVGAGIVFIDGVMMRFYGMGAVTLPAQFQRGGFELLDQRPYQTGGTKTCIKERVAVLVDTDVTYAGGEYIPFDTWGGKRWEHVLKATTRDIGQMQMVAPEDYVPAHYDAAGRGVVGGAAWGWQLLNGDGGITNMQQKFPVGADDSIAYAPGTTGGAATHTLTEAEIPSLSMRLFGSDNNGGDGGFPDLGDDGDQAAAQGAGRFRDNAVKTLNTLGRAHNNLPPFVAIPMRKWVGYEI